MKSTRDNSPSDEAEEETITILVLGVGGCLGTVMGLVIAFITLVVQGRPPIGDWTVEGLIWLGALLTIALSGGVLLATAWDRVVVRYTREGTIQTWLELGALGLSLIVPGGIAYAFSVWAPNLVWPTAGIAVLLYLVALTPWMLRWRPDPSIPATRKELIGSCWFGLVVGVLVGGFSKFGFGPGLYTGAPFGLLAVAGALVAIVEAPFALAPILHGHPPDGPIAEVVIFGVSTIAASGVTWAVITALGLRAPW